MNNKTFMAFIVGAAAGAGTAWLYAKKYFGQQIDDVIVKCNAVEAEEQPKISKQEEKEESETPAEAKKGDDGLVRYNKAIKENEYSDKVAQKPYFISPDEFRDGTMITAVTWSYFEDGVVTDENDNIVDDVEQAIGNLDLLVDAFGDEDIAYIRNEDRKCDYEILREGEYYSDPPDAED